MRFSEILKTTESSTGVSTKLSAQTSAVPAASRLSQQDLTAMIEKMREEVKSQLQEQFQSQLEEIKSQAKLAQAAILKAEEEKSFARAEALKKEKLQLAEQLERLKAKNEELQAAQQSFMPLTSQTLQPQIMPPVFNPEDTRAAQIFYEKLIHAGRGILDQCRKGQGFEFSLFLKMVRELMSISPELQEELVGIFMEPYPESEYFVYQSVNCMILSVLLGSDLKLEGKSLEDLGLAAFLHDIALLNVKDPLSNPKQLSENLREDIRKHPERGAEMVAPYVNEAVKIAIFQHRELSNGKGYPQGLLNDAIHIYAKIINVADSFEAMVHVRPYRQQPYEVSEAVKEMIEKERGLYDRDVIKALLSRVGLYPVKSYIELSNKQVARVLRQNRFFPISPIVRVEFDEDGNKIIPPNVLDLSKNQLMHIIGPLKTTHSYTKEKLSKERRKNEAQNRFFLIIKEMIPLLMMAALLALLVYVVVKI